jgi:soluble lytic murein transglycosylase
MRGVGEGLSSSLLGRINLKRAIQKWIVFIISLLGLVLGWSDAAWAAQSKALDPIIAAHEAYLNHDISALEKLEGITTHHLLSGYVRFWLMESRLSNALRLVPATDLHQFMIKEEGALAEQLQQDWLKAAIQQHAWSAVLSEMPSYTGNDPELVCGFRAARQAQGEPDSLQDIKALWFTGKSMPAACDSLFAQLISEGRLSMDDVFLRFQLALNADNLSLAKNLSHFFAKSESGLSDESFSSVATDPDKWLKQNIVRSGTRADRALMVYAIYQIARGDLIKANSIWDQLPSDFSAGARARGWAKIGMQASLQLDPFAVTAFRRSREGPPTDTELEWWVRAALRNGFWDDVLLATGMMSENEMTQPAWRYWRARALKHAGRREEAQVLFTSITKEHDFYSQLAREEMGVPLILPNALTLDQQDLTFLRSKPGIQRALALSKLGLQKEAVKEWNFAIRDLKDQQLLAAAEVARQTGWYDRMIASGERAGSESDASFRYPMPFKDTVHNHSQTQGLDEAWVYGLMRQESRFLAEARSRVGASGLMQIMPATSRWIAHKLGVKDFKVSHVEDVETNVRFGSFYLRHILDDLGHPVLATAGYNAGPSRVRRWLEPHPLEGAIFCETIPITETRDYVKKVMANASMYNARLGQPAQSLKTRLGTIQALGGLKASAPEESAFDSLLPPPSRTVTRFLNDSVSAQ